PTTSVRWARQQGAKVYARVRLDGGNGWTEWTEAAPGNFPGIDQTTDLSNARIQYRVELETADVSITPFFDGLSYVLTSAYKPSQTFALPPVDVSNIGTVARSVLHCTVP